jgi:hypothetical protein
MKQAEPSTPGPALEALSSYGRWLHSQVGPEDAATAASRAFAARSLRSPRRWVVAVAVAGLLLIGNVGLAAVSDGAAPGDPLYGLDRAYEQVGQLLGLSDHATERLHEAEVLLARGRSQTALEVTEEALEELEIETALSDLLAAPPGIEEANQELAAETEELVTLAFQVHLSAKDSTDRRAAIAALREQVQRVVEAARSHAQGPKDGSPPGHQPSDHPGQTGGPPADSPGETAPHPQGNSNRGANQP